MIQATRLPPGARRGSAPGVSFQGRRSGEPAASGMRHRASFVRGKQVPGAGFQAQDRIALPGKDAANLALGKGQRVDAGGRFDEKSLHHPDRSGYAGAPPARHTAAGPTRCCAVAPLAGRAPRCRREQAFEAVVGLGGLPVPAVSSLQWRFRCGRAHAGHAGHSRRPAGPPIRHPAHPADVRQLRRQHRAGLAINLANHNQPRLLSEVVVGRSRQKRDALAGPPTTPAAR